MTPVLHARMFAYPDAARYRLGTNYQQLPTNAAHAPVYCPYQRDGFMNFSSNYHNDPNYVGSSLRPTAFATSSTTSKKPVASTITEHEKWVGEVCNYTSTVDDKDLEQATALWKVLGREPGQQDRYVDNVAVTVQGVTNAKLRDKVYGMCYSSPRYCVVLWLTPVALYSRVDPQLGARIKASTEAKLK